MSQPAAKGPTTTQRILDAIERLGNRVPHPAVLFFLLLVLVIVLSHLLYWLGVSVFYQRIDPETHKAEYVTTAVQSLLSADGIRYMFTSVVPNFINFGPVGIIIVAMIGVGLAERAGLIGALLRVIVRVAPRSAITAIIVTLGVISSIASDAGYLVLIPLGAAAFLGLGRHPLVGLAAAFSGVAATFAVNFLVVPVDGILAEITTDAVRLVDPSKSIDITANFYFGIASSILLIVICTLLTDRIIEPRAGVYSGEVSAEQCAAASGRESRGLVFAFVALIAFLAVLALLTVPSGAPLRNQETGAILGKSPLMDSLVFIIMVVFFVMGAAYGVGAGTIRNANDAISAVTRSIADLSDLLFLFFVIGQFVACFNYSNMGTILAVRLADTLKDANLSSVTLLMGFLAVGLVLSIPVPNVIPKWAILAPVFVPLFLKLGIAPDALLAAYRVSDSPMNVVNPLLPHFALVVGFAQKYKKDAGVGTIVAIMIPYALVTFVAWTILFFAWFLLGLPFGPA